MGNSSGNYDPLRRIFCRQLYRSGCRKINAVPGVKERALFSNICNNKKEPHLNTFMAKLPLFEQKNNAVVIRGGVIKKREVIYHRVM
jgi:hypothetical protein